MKAQTPRRYNDRERELWVSNDEALYNWLRTSRLPLRVFVRTHREGIDTYIRAQLGRPPRA